MGKESSLYLEARNTILGFKLDLNNHQMQHVKIIN